MSSYPPVSQIDPHRSSSYSHPARSSHSSHLSQDGALIPHPQHPRSSSYSHQPYQQPGQLIPRPQAQPEQVVPRPYPEHQYSQQSYQSHYSYRDEYDDAASHHRHHHHHHHDDRYSDGRHADKRPSLGDTVVLIWDTIWGALTGKRR